jgi:hypothetical protein
LGAVGWPACSTPGTAAARCCRRPRRAGVHEYNRTRRSLDEAGRARRALVRGRGWGAARAAVGVRDHRAALPSYAISVVSRPGIPKPRMPDMSPDNDGIADFVDASTPRVGKADLIFVFGSTLPDARHRPCRRIARARTTDRPDWWPEPPETYACRERRSHAAAPVAGNRAGSDARRTTLAHLRRERRLRSPSHRGTWWAGADGDRRGEVVATPTGACAGRRPAHRRTDLRRDLESARRTDGAPTTGRPGRRVRIGRASKASSST